MPVVVVLGIVIVIAALCWIVFLLVSLVLHLLSEVDRRDELIRQQNHALGTTEQMLREGLDTRA